MGDRQGLGHPELRLPRAHHGLRHCSLPHGPGQEAREEDRRDSHHLQPARHGRRPPGRVRPQLGADRTVAYVHDLAGRVSRLIYPDGSQARYAYDGAGRLARVWDARGATLASYTHTAAGNMERHVVGDGIVTGTFTYNLREWVTEINYPGRFTVKQQYDGVGNVTSQRYQRAASESRKVAAYSYDRLHRLTAFNLAGGPSRYYRYDRRGNLLDMQTNGSLTLYRYENSSAPNRVSYVYGGGLNIRAAYNPNGWMTRMSRNALTYDYRGLLTGHGSAAYTMDPDRRRVKKTVGTAVTYYVRGADGAVLAEYDGSQAMTARYVYAGSSRIARVAAGSGTSYYLADHLGSTRSLIDEAGDVTAAYDYWPYGKMLASSGAESTHFRFTGHERDDESRLDYMLERSYAYETGRFLRPDPMQDEYPGISPYAYANNNPLKYVDPDGNSHHEPQDQYDANQIVQDRFDEGGVEVANAIANLPGYVKSGAERGAEAFVDYSLDFAETSVESGIVISDALSDGSIAGAVAGTAGVAVGIATRNPALAAGSVKFTYTMLSVNTGANAASTVFKGVDAMAFDGSSEAFYSQFMRTALGFGGTRILSRTRDMFITRTASSVTGPFFYSPASGRFVSNGVGFTTTAASDATSIGFSISVDSLFDQ